MAFAVYLQRPTRVRAQQIVDPNGVDLVTPGGPLHGNPTDWVVDYGGGFFTIMTDTDFSANFILRALINL